MQVRQCEATVDFTGRDRGYVTSPSHRTASNRTVPYHTHTAHQAVAIRVCLPASIAAHRCPTLVADWPASEEGGSRTMDLRLGWEGRGHSRAEREVCATLGDPFIPDCRA